MEISQKYVDYVKKTANPNYTVEMAACALLEELFEYSASNATDEFGDVLYQFVLFCQILGFDVSKLNLENRRGNRITFSILEITSQYKKKITRGKEIDYKLIEECLSEICYTIAEFATFAGFDIKEIEEENMKKLNERYGVND